MKMVLTRHSRCLIPSTLVESPDPSVTRFDRMVEVLFMKNHITSSCAVDSKVLRIHKRGEFLQYDKPSCDITRLNEFYLQYLNHKMYSNLAQVVKIILTLSHVQASVEGFFGVLIRLYWLKI